MTLLVLFKDLWIICIVKDDTIVFFLNLGFEIGLERKKGWHPHSIEKDCNIKVFENNNHVHLKIYVRLECNVTCPNIVCTHYLFYQTRPTISYKFTMTLLMFGPPQDDNVRSSENFLLGLSFLHFHETLLLPSLWRKKSKGNFT